MSATMTGIHDPEPALAGGITGFGTAASAAPASGFPAVLFSAFGGVAMTMRLR